MIRLSADIDNVPPEIALPVGAILMIVFVLLLIREARQEVKARREYNETMNNVSETSIVTVMQNGKRIAINQAPAVTKREKQNESSIYDQDDWTSNIG